MSTYTTQGLSKEARIVAASTRAGNARFRQSNVLGIAFVHEELGSVWEACKVEDWDGQGADAIEQETLCNAYRVLEALPIGCPPPSIGAEPDGAITLEWYRSPRHTLSVSVNADGDLDYAALLGPSRQFGTEYFGGDVPARILKLIAEISGK